MVPKRFGRCQVKVMVHDEDDEDDKVLSFFKTDIEIEVTQGKVASARYEYR